MIRSLVNLMAGLAWLQWLYDALTAVTAPSPDPMFRAIVILYERFQILWCVVMLNSCSRYYCYKSFLEAFMCFLLLTKKRDKKDVEKTPLFIKIFYIKNKIFLNDLFWENIWLNFVFLRRWVKKNLAIQRSWNIL